MTKLPMGPPPGPPPGPQVRAVHSHLAQEESQLQFTVGDIIVLMGDHSDGWQFGHNPRSQQ